MQETIKRWGLGGLIVGAFVSLAFALSSQIITGIKSLHDYWLVPLVFSLPGALMGLFSGLCIALFWRAIANVELFPNIFKVAHELSSGCVNRAFAIIRDEL